MTKPSKATVTLVGAWLAVAAGATGRVFDVLPGGCADGVGCIFSMGMITSWLALPIVIVFGALTIAFSVQLRLDEHASQSRRWRVIGAIGAMTAAVVIVAADWFYPYWPRY